MHGIDLNTNKDRMKFARKDLHVMCYLGFSHWKSVELLADQFLNRRGAATQRMLDHFKAQSVRPRLSLRD